MGAWGALRRSNNRVVVRVVLPWVDESGCARPCSLVAPMCHSVRLFVCVIAVQAGLPEGMGTLREHDGTVRRAANAMRGCVCDAPPSVALVGSCRCARASGGLEPSYTAGLLHKVRARVRTAV